MNTDLSLLVACFGLTRILMFGTILNKPRNIIKRINFFKELLNCALCTGTWVGVFIGLLNYNPTTQYIQIIELALASAGFCYFFHSLLEMILTWNWEHRDED